MLGAQASVQFRDWRTRIVNTLVFQDGLDHTDVFVATVTGALAARKERRDLLGGVVVFKAQ